MKKLILIITLLVVNHLYIFPQKVGDVYLLNANNIQLPMSRKGVLADVIIPPFGSGGKFDSITVIFSAGFFMGGYNGDSLWANGVASSMLVEDYWQGTVQTGIYNPVDLNSNGVWDPDEDAPDMIGDQTLWCVYNDGVPLELRRWESEPQGIEIYQTIFLDGTSQSPQGNIIYLRYRILNSGTVAETLDSVYFTAYADMDIGGFNDDLCGSDTILQTGYTYNDSSDSDFGDNPPAVAITQLQGPYAYIPGITFIDVNGNGVYDEGIDIPLTTAYNHKGQFIGIDSLAGAMNLGITSFMSYPCGGNPVLCDPRTTEEARYQMLGMNNLGEHIDPCTWWGGEVRGGVNCADVNPLFMYSGDPVTDIGWINTDDGDQRMTMSAGPFQLEEGKPVDIILAYSIGRGIDALNSVTEMKSISQYALSIYESNFDIETSVDELTNNLIPNEFQLFQNYPNPFNPVTTIKYRIPKLSFVTIKVYDVLGSKVATLVNEQSATVGAGNYEVEFYGIGLPSGIYFYQLRAGNFAETKKMILLK
jgi:hypothetical protein